MNRISSGFTVVSKWVFPIFWFGFLAFFVGQTLLDGTAKEDPAFLLGPLFMAVVGFFVMRYLAWDLADSVHDCGSYLLVRRSGTEVRIPFENVMNVSSTVFVNPPRVTLRLIKPCDLGSDVSFSPRSSFSLNPFARNAVAEELIERAYAARTKSAR
jgi:hypothetical protein